MQGTSEVSAGVDPGPAPGWINLLGVRISAVNLEGAAASITQAIARGEKGYVCIRDAHGVIRAQRDAELRGIHNAAFMVTPDGMPLVWALRAAGYASADRVYGPDLMLALLDGGRREGLRHFFYGSTPQVLGELSRRVSARFPGVIVAGCHAPPFRTLTPAEQEAEIARIEAARADIVWVGLGTPKQELWMGRMRHRLSSGMLIGVGAAFDFHAGRVRQAPRAIQRSGLEWAFRLACEPRRLWRRYAVTVPGFAWLCALQALGLRRFSIAVDDPAAAVPAVVDGNSGLGRR